MASLEDLPESEKRKLLNLGNMVAGMINNPKLSKDTKKLLKAADPNLQFPELDTDERIEKIREEGKQTAEELRQQLAQRDAREALQAEETKITEAGLDPKAVRAYMSEKGILDVEVVIELFQARQQLAEPSADQLNGTARFSDVPEKELNAMWANPSAYRQQKAEEILRESRGGRRARA